MRFVLMTEPQQGMSYLDQLAIARRAEDVRRQSDAIRSIASGREALTSNA